MNKQEECNRCTNALMTIKESYKGTRFEYDKPVEEAQRVRGIMEVAGLCRGVCGALLSAMGFEPKESDKR